MKSRMLVMMGLSVVIGTGCASTSMQLRDLQKDIPLALVKQYKASDKAYVDEGSSFFLPLLFEMRGYVSKTSNGFQAMREGSLLLLFEDAEEADFDQEGRLLKYSGDGSVLTGLILRQHDERSRINEVMNDGGGWSILWGAIGFRERPSGERTLVVLWIPIPAGRGTRP